MRFWGIVVLGAGLALGGCGDDDGGSGADAGRDAGGGDGGGGAGALTVHVYRVDDGVATDADGVAVALDTGSGRLDGTTGADGTFRFEGVDFASELVTVSAWEAGRVLLGIQLGAEPTDALPMYLLEAGTPRDDLVELSGTVAGMADSANTLIVSATTGDGFTGTGTAWSMQALPGEAGTLVAHEIAPVAGVAARLAAYDVSGTASVGYDAPTGDTAVDLDFGADAVGTSDVTGSFAVPSSARPSSSLNEGDVFVRVSSRSTGLFLGMPSRMELSADDSTVEYDLTYAELGAVDDPVTWFSVSDTPEAAAVLVDGWPTAGAQDVVFLDPPTITAPEFGVDLAWGETIRWETADTETPTAIQVYDRASRYLRAIVVVAPGRSSGSLPAPPGDATVADVLDGSTVDARINVCDPTGAPEPWMCQRYARSRGFGVTP